MNGESPESPRVGSYVYCVGYARALVDGGSSLNVPGVEGPERPVRAVAHGDLAAIVSDCSKTRLDVSRENLLAHERVVQEAMARSDILPMAFGTVATSDDEVRLKLLERGAEEIRQGLEYVRGCVQLNLKVFWKRDVLFAEVAAESQDIRDLRDYVAQRSEDQSYYERIRLGELTARALEIKSDEEAQAILNELDPLSVDAHVDSNTSELMLLNGSFLVEKATVETFDARVQAIGEAQQDRLIFRYVGPLPPYDFADVDLSWED